MKKISFFKWIKKYIKREFRRLREKHLLKVEHPTVTIDDDVVIKNPSRLALGENIYIIAEGHVFLERSIDLGSRKGCALIGTLGRGRALGCWSTLLDEPHNLMASAACQKTTTVVMMRGADLRDMMLDNVGLGLNVFRKLCYILRGRLQGAFGAMEKI